MFKVPSSFPFPPPIGRLLESLGSLLRRNLRRRNRRSLIDQFPPRSSDSIISSLLSAFLPSRPMHLNTKGTFFLCFSFHLFPPRCCFSLYVEMGPPLFSLFQHYFIRPQIGLSRRVPYLDVPSLVPILLLLTERALTSSSFPCLTALSPSDDTQHLIRSHFETPSCNPLFFTASCHGSLFRLPLPLRKGLTYCPFLHVATDGNSFLVALLLH